MAVDLVIVLINIICNNRINVRCIALSVGQVVHKDIQTLVFLIKKLLSPPTKLQSIIGHVGK